MRPRHDPAQCLQFLRLRVGAGSVHESRREARRRGDGAWLKRAIGKTEQWADRLAVADINRDGLLDIVTGEIFCYPASVYWFEQPRDPNGEWTRHTIVTQYPTSAMDLAEVNGDGQIDIITADIAAAASWRGGRIGAAAPSGWSTLSTSAKRTTSARAGSNSRRRVSPRSPASLGIRTATRICGRSSRSV
jgi:hypothetical protein